MPKYTFFDEPISVGNSAPTPKDHQERKEETISERYRCEQINLIKVNGMPTMHATIRTEYIANYQPGKKSVEVKMQDYTQDIIDQDLAMGMEMVKGIEDVKGQLFAEINDYGKIERLLNLEELRESWINFRDNVLPEIPVFQELRKQELQAAQDIVHYGDLEFSEEKHLITQFERNLFHHCYFQDYLTRKQLDFTGDTLSFASQIFQDISLEISREPFISGEDDFTFTVTKAGVLNKALIDERELKRQYDLLYLPLIKYNYTEFNLEYSMRYTVSKESSMLIDATLDIIESVKNNYESVCSFRLKQVKL